MDYQFMDVLTKVRDDLIKDGMSEQAAQGLINKLIWIFVCRL